MKTLRRFYNLERSQSRLAVVLISPTILLVIIILLFPLVYSFILSFGDLRLIDLTNYDFIGLKNYIDLLKDQRFLYSLFVSAQFSFSTILLKLIFGLIIAVILKEKFIGRSIIRSIIIVPWAVPFTAAGVFWRLILHSQNGILNYFLLKFKVIEHYLPFLADKRLAMPSIIVADVWQGTPFFVIVLLAGLQTIPDEIYEAAKIDGAGGIRSFFSITLPMIKPQIFVVTIIGTIFAINHFDLFFILTRGGPSYYTRSSTLYAWDDAFRSFNISHASAASYIILALTLIITSAYIILIRKRGELHES